MVRVVWGSGASVKLFGSRMNGMALPSSDVDLVLIISELVPGLSKCAGGHSRR